MTHPPEDQDGTRSEVSETDGAVTGADAVPDKTADTPAKGASFDEVDEDRPSGGDESVRDQD